MEIIKDTLAQAEERLIKNPFSKPILIGDLLNSPEEQVPWLVTGLIPAGGLTAFSGMPGDFKTWVELEIAIAVASGKLLFGQFETVQGNVLIIDEENNKNLLRSRLKALSANNELKIYIWVKEGVKADMPSHMVQIIKFVKANDIKLVCFDSLVRIHSKEENDAKQMAQLFAHFNPLLKLGVTVLFTHHHRKNSVGQSKPGSQNMRGSSDILASVDCHLMISRNKDEHKLRISQEKLRVAEELKPFEVNIVSDGEYLSLEYGSPVAEHETRQEEARADILELLEQGAMSQGEIKQLLKGRFGGNSTGKALAALVAEGVIIETVGDKNKKTYELVSEPEAAV